jgi:hypothetical protein
MGNVANSTGRSIPEIKDSTREDMNLKGESLVEDKPDGDPRGGLGASTKAIERPLKREEIENGNSTKGTERTASITATTRKASKHPPQSTQHSRIPSLTTFRTTEPSKDPIRKAQAAVNNSSPRRRTTRDLRCRATTKMTRMSRSQVLLL